jgi:hypothetical protein
VVACSQAARRLAVHADNVGVRGVERTLANHRRERAAGAEGAIVDGSHLLGTRLGIGLRIVLTGRLQPGQVGDHRGGLRVQHVTRLRQRGASALVVRRHPHRPGVYALLLVHGGQLT